MYIHVTYILNLLKSLTMLHDPWILARHLNSSTVQMRIECVFVCVCVHIGVNVQFDNKNPARRNGSRLIAQEECNHEQKCVCERMSMTHLSLFVACVTTQSKNDDECYELSN